MNDPHDNYDELINSFTELFSSKSLLKNSINQSISSFHSPRLELLKTQSLPMEGWSDAAIEAFLLELAGMDANNFDGVVGMGEREGRISNNLVRRRHFGFAHGMGRSGNLKDSQPKAVGSTLISHLTHKLAVSALRTWGFGKHILAGGLNIMPVCTGMSLMLALTSINSEFKKVIWLRIDQKSCLKSILAANFELIIVEGKLSEDSDEIVSDLNAIEKAISDSNGQIHAIVSCISCFAPRAPDSIVKISELAKKYSIAHVVNAAYGGTSSRACNLLNNAVINGRIDAVVMSLDKNFMVPVGGAIIFGPNQLTIERITTRYAGRAGISHIIDLFITLISLGRIGLERLKTERIKCFNHFRDELTKIKEIIVMKTPHNDISFAIKLPEGFDSSLGSQLFHRNVSGARVIEINDNMKTIEGFEFLNFGSHYSKWNEKFCYMNVAAAVGSKCEDIQIFLKKLNKLLNK